MDAIDLSIRERLHRAGAEISARPLSPDGARDVHAPRSLRPLLAAVALAAVVGMVAGGMGLHSRLAGHGPGPAATPPAGGPSPGTRTPGATPAYQAAPFMTMYSNVQTGWDSTHRKVVTYIAASPKTNVGAQVWSWDGRWHQVDASGGPGDNQEGIWLDDPALHGMVMIGGNAKVASGNWLWDGRAWSALPDTPTQSCMGPAQGAWDVHHGQLVVLFTDQCSGGDVVLPTETWTLDGRTWHQRADTPGNGPSAMAWDPQANAVVMLGPDGSGKARAWTWTGGSWSRGAASTVVWPPGNAAAAWDAARGALILYSDRISDGSGIPAHVLTYSKGHFAEIPQSGAPMYTEGVFADTTDGRLLALGQQAEPAAATPAPWDERQDYYVIAWTGTTWTPVLDLSSLRTPRS